jgi:N6-adenosine-specific RNA methylase IME4
MTKHRKTITLITRNHNSRNGNDSPKFGTIFADPPWQFMNRTGKMAPEHRRLHRYKTMKLAEICSLPVREIAAEQSHLYLWVPNALLAEGLQVMHAWGFTYKTNIVWYKVRKDGGPDGRGVGFYFRNVTELLLFGTRGRLRTLPPGRREVNIVVSRKQEHSRKPEKVYDIIERCSRGPYLELFARSTRRGWTQWGDEAATNDDLKTLRPSPLAAPPREHNWFEAQSLLPGMG